MLFNSFEFLFAFLPISLTVFYLILRFQRSNPSQLAIAWLVIASLFFYAWWNPKNLAIIIVSILVNYGIGLVLNNHSLKQRIRQALLGAGIGFNLLLIGYYKYANFLVDNVNHLTGYGIAIDDIVLPLAISFFTFQQIAYLVDSYRGETREYNFLKYCLFVTFFPQLIAGPIVHHRDIIPQFEDRSGFRLNSSNLAIGSIVFFIGLFKKIIFANRIALYVAPVFIACVYLLSSNATVFRLAIWHNIYPGNIMR
jgi:D-alanyl-lipoteichoic acid acyltransferase DltB (MBOAT superfamily)